MDTFALGAGNDAAAQFADLSQSSARALPETPTARSLDPKVGSEGRGSNFFAKRRPLYPLLLSLRPK